MAEYLGVQVSIAENDPASRAFLEGAEQGELVLQRCTDCRKLRYPAGAACPFCMSLTSEWVPVSGRGTIYSYEIVAHPIHPAFRPLVPYPLVLVELDEQRGVPGPDDGLRVLSMLVDADGLPELEERVAIGLRVEVDFCALGDGLALPRFRLSDEPPEHAPWRFEG